MPKLRNTRLLNYNMTVFVVCIGIAAFTWTLIKLSSSYSTELTFPVTYSNPPKNLILVNDVDSLIRIGLEEQGFVLARLKYFQGRSALKIDLEKAKIRKLGRGYICRVSTQEWVLDIANEFDINGEISFVKPDTIIFQFEDVVSKKVDVIPDISYTFQKQYYPYDSLFLEPTQVNISGLSSIIDTIEYLRTESAQFQNLSESIEAMVNVSNPLPHDLDVNPPIIKASLSVEKYTESETIIPISFQNEIRSQRVKIFPDKVKVVYLVALKDFRRVNTEMFSASVDLSKVNEMNDKKIPIQIDAYPSFVRIKKIDPPLIEFLILK